MALHGTSLTNYALTTGGTFTGTITVTPAANTSAYVASGYSLTGSNAQSLVDLAGTWNTTGTPTAIKLNVTDTASNASSLLMDLQVGGSSKVKADKSGNVTAAKFVGTQASQDPIIESSTAFAIRNTTNGLSTMFFDQATGGATHGQFIWRSSNGYTTRMTLDNNGNLTVAGGYISASSYSKTGTTVVASLPAAATAGAGARYFVTDANATTFLSTVAGGGANAVPVVSDGTNWLIG